MLEVVSEEAAGDDRLAAFQASLRTLPPDEIVQRFVTSAGTCAKISDSQHGDLSQSIASKFNVHHSEIFIVGSAKLGFSIAPGKLWRPFGNSSDIDVAIVSTTLYLSVWRQISELLNDDAIAFWDKRQVFAYKHLTGWIRPDLFPPSPALPLADEWFEFFREITNSRVCGPYKVSAGIYYDIHFLEQYQRQAVSQCMQSEG